MPIYEYRCTACEFEFEELMSMHSNEKPVCPKCQSRDCNKKMSISGGVSSKGACGSKIGGFT